MPSKNSIKFYSEGSIYHVYNRGVEKRNIFLDEQDYAVFLHLLKYYFSPIEPNQIHPLMEFQNFSLIRPRPIANLETEVSLIEYCLMPNHFHLIIKQETVDGMTKLMRKLLTTYSMYFNKRYDRVGHLFQGRYKAVLVKTDSYLLHLSGYIHLNPLELTGTVLVNYPYSSYKYFIGKAHAGWIKPKIVLDYFDKTKLQPFWLHYPSYQEFVENKSEDSAKIIGDIALE